MQPQQNFNDDQGAARQNGSVVCGQCGAPMPQGMRFCRSCGNRLGEGPAEYTETVRLPNAQGTGPQFSNFGPGYTAPIAKQTGGDVPFKRRRRISGMAWILIAIAFFFAFGGIMSLVRKNRPGTPRGTFSSSNRSYFGVNGFEDTESGVTFADVEPPDSPADRAGLVGGDIITSFDGKPVSDRDDIMKLLEQTVPGKTVEIVYLRDGEVKKTLITTISRQESQELEAAFRNRAGGQGQLGFDDGETKVVPIAGTKIKGVQLNEISPSGPAALGGLQEGDIITEFDGVPIRTTGELVSRVRRAIPYSTIKLIVFRGTEQLEIPLKIGKRG